MSLARAPRQRPCETFKFQHPAYDAALDECEAMMDLGRVRPGHHIQPRFCDRCRSWHAVEVLIVFRD